MVTTVNKHIRERARKAWWRMLFRPRDTLRARLRATRSRPWLLLGALVGLAQVCNAPFLYAGAGAGARDAIAWIAVVGPVAGWVLALALGLLLSRLGRLLFRGTGDPSTLRLAFLWGCLPLVYSLLLWIPLILVAWGPDWIQALAAVRPFVAGFVIWTAWTLSQAVAEAHEIRGVQGFALVVLAFSIVSLPLSFLAAPPGG